MRDYLTRRVRILIHEIGLDERLAELIQRIFNDAHPTAEGAYVFAQSKDNEDSGFQGGKDALSRLLVPKLFIIKGEAKNGFPGYDSWNQKLEELVGETYVQGVPIEDPSQVNTLSESEALVRFAREQEHTTLYVISPAFHQMRAFMTAASVAIREYPALNLFNFPGTPQEWDQMVVHSQGLVRATRSKLIEHELIRIERYQRKGDIAPVGDILAYMNNRVVRVPP